MTFNELIVELGFKLIKSVDNELGVYKCFILGRFEINYLETRQSTLIFPYECGKSLLVLGTACNRQDFTEWKDYFNCSGEQQ